jgi:hypothetical protein
MSLKTLSSVLDGEPSIHTLPDSPQSESASAVEKPVIDAKPEPSAKPDKAKTAGHEPDDDEDEEIDASPEESDPVKLRESVAKLQKSLKASRAEKRSFKQSDKDRAQRVAALEAQLQALQRPQQQPVAQGPKPEDLEAEFYKDPVGFQEKQRKALQQEMQQQSIRTKLQISDAYARRAHPDYAEKMAVWQEALRANPTAAQYALQQDDPMEYAYQTAKRIMLNREIGDDPEAWREAERAKLRAEIEATKQPDARPAPVAPTRSIAAARGSGGISQPQPRGPRSLKEAIG